MIVRMKMISRASTHLTAVTPLYGERKQGQTPGKAVGARAPILPNWPGQLRPSYQFGPARRTN